MFFCTYITFTLKICILSFTKEPFFVTTNAKWRHHEATNEAVELRVIREKKQWVIELMLYTTVITHNRPYIEQCTDLYSATNKMNERDDRWGKLPSHEQTNSQRIHKELWKHLLHYSSSFWSYWRRYNVVGDLMRFNLKIDVDTTTSRTISYLTLWICQSTPSDNSI